MSGNLTRQLASALRQTMSRNTSARLPEGGGLVWGWFADLCGTRTYHDGGPNPISYQEIDAYARLMRWPMEPKHVEIIRELDAQWMKIAAGGDGSRQRPPLTAAAFDALVAA